MPAYPVLQPDGQLAVWSTVVDNFIAFDLSVESATYVIGLRHSGNVKEICQRVANGEKPFDHWKDWFDCVGLMIGRYGEDDAEVQAALTRTPDRRIPDLIASIWNAEGRMNDAIDVLLRYGQIDGAHHKQWVIDQALRALTGDDYTALIQSACDGEDGADTYTWEVGIAP